MIQQIFGIVFPLFALVLVGFFYGRYRTPDMAAANQMNMDLFIPALIFHVMSNKEFELAQYGDLAVAAMVVVLGSGLIAWPIARLFGYPVRTFIPPMMFSNSGNMGLPLALFAFGEQALPAAVVLFIVENTLHFTLGMRMMDPRASLLAIFRVPMLLATLAGLLVGLLKIPLPQVLLVPIEMAGQVAIPLMLFSLGVRLTAVDLKDGRIGLVGALVCPGSGLLIAVLLQPVLQLAPDQFGMLLVFSVLPPAVLNFMIAERFGQEPHRVASIVMLGNLSSIVIIPLMLAVVLSRSG
ncbi:MAG: AEC family transporter [Gammaproteobacteria bacterium]|nr:AEC family transporter [Gammaproteobacteria bacterium]